MNRTVSVNYNFIIFFLLLTAFLNPILRISAQSNITLFRILLPFAVIVIFLSSKEVFKRLFFGEIILCLYTLIQYTITTCFTYQYISFDLLYYVEFIFLYSSIIIVVALVFCIQFVGENESYNQVDAFLCSFVKSIALFMFFYTVLLGKPITDIKTADNINNIGCIMTGGMCLLLGFQKKKKTNIVWCVIILFLLWYNDSKAAFLGASFGLGIYVLYLLSTRISRGNLIVRRALVLIFALAICILLIISPSINNYPLADIVIEPLERITTGRMFENADSSITYRTNSSIVALSIIKKTLGFGVGLGNTARILREVMSDAYNGEWAMKATSFSLHNWWLELMCDMGWPIIILEISILLKEIKWFLVKERRTCHGAFCSLLFLTFPLWSISASGLITEYYTIVLITYAYIIHRNKNIEYDSKDQYFFLERCL